MRDVWVEALAKFLFPPFHHIASNLCNLWQKDPLIMNTPVLGCYHPVKSPSIPSIELPFPHWDCGCGMMRVPHSDLHSNDPRACWYKNHLFEQLMLIEINTWEVSGCKYLVHGYQQMGDASLCLLTLSACWIHLIVSHQDTVFAKRITFHESHHFNQILGIKWQTRRTNDRSWLPVNHQ